MKKRVVVGLSGGVDSSVAAARLIDEGYDVIGVFMVNWHDTQGLLSGDCPNKDDKIFAELVARKLNIPFHVVDLSDDYRKRVVEYMFAEYENGRTPNPDVLCNREVKFDLFIKAVAQFEPDFVATGHYCRKETILVEGKPVHRLLAGTDPNKDQSYFLCQLSQQQLEKAMFPIGDTEKPEVRKIAKAFELATADKKDSQGICFVGKVNLPEFLQQQLKPKRGNIIEIARNSELYSNYPPTPDAFESVESYLQEVCKPFGYAENLGFKTGEHNGAHYYTIGQRKGLDVGGKPLPLFVLAINTTTNTVYVGQGKDHQGLFRKALFVKTDEIHWIREDLRMNIDEQREYMVRIRYRQPLEKATLYMKKEGLYIVFESLQRGIAPGQFAAWYAADELIGSGVIS